MPVLRHAFVCFAALFLSLSHPGYAEPPSKSSGFPKTTASKAGIDTSALLRLTSKAEETNSDALIILKDGKLVTEKYFGGGPTPIHAMSVSKAFVSLAVGILWDEGKIKSLDQPVADFFPEWKSDPQKSKVTIRHILTQTSGIKANRTTEEIYASQDFVKLALDAPLATEPGSAFFYNNKALNLLAGVVEKASGKKLDVYLDEKLFHPMDITETDWSRDRAGNPHGMAGLYILPMDLAKVGQLMLNGGVWNGKRLLSERYIKEATSDQFRAHYPQVITSSISKRLGLIWWLDSEVLCVVDDSMIPYWRKGGASEAFLTKVKPLINKPMHVPEFNAAVDRLFPGRTEWQANTTKLNMAACNQYLGPQLSYGHSGSLGQFLLIMPQEKLVAVRMIASQNAKDPETGFYDFSRYIWALVGRSE